MMDKIPEEIKERVDSVGGTPINEGDGYWSLTGTSSVGIEALSLISMSDGNGVNGKLIYIQLPKGHPDINKKYDNLEPDVNGGLTYSYGPLFGWDYCHAYNEGTPIEDIKNAIKYFKKRG